MYTLDVYSYKWYKDIELITMIKDSDLEYQYIEGVQGYPLVWVIDGDCLYELALYEKFAKMFVDCTRVEDVSHEYPDNDGITVRFFKNNEVMEDFNTSEYFGCILLSEPLVLNLLDYPYGRYVQSPHAKFDGEKFIITNRNVEGLLPWYPQMEK